jgi:hypothetical protein
LCDLFREQWLPAKGRIVRDHDCDPRTGVAELLEVGRGEAVRCKLAAIDCAAVRLLAGEQERSRHEQHGHCSILDQVR